MARCCSRLRRRAPSRSVPRHDRAAPPSRAPQPFSQEERCDERRADEQAHFLPTPARAEGCGGSVLHDVVPEVGSRPPASRSEHHRDAHHRQGPTVLFQNARS
jgi:hypothetical protein